MEFLKLMGLRENLLTWHFVIGLVTIHWLARRVAHRRQNTAQQPASVKECLEPQEYEGNLDDETRAEIAENRFLESTADRFDRMGNTFQVSNMKNRSRTIHTIEPANIQTWAALQMDRFSRFELHKEMADAIWGVGILNADGHVWRQLRALIRPTFQRERVAHLQFFKPHVDSLIERLPTDRTIDLFRYFKDYIFDSGTEFLFGESALSQTPSAAKKDALAFMSAFEAITIAIGKRRHIGMQAVIEQTDWQSNVQTLYSYIDVQVTRALENCKAKSAEQSYTGRTALLEKMAEQSTDPELLRNQILQVFTPAHESTGSLLASIFYALANNPAAQRKLREQILNSPADEPTWEVLKSLPYLRYVVNETLRLWPLFVSNSRLCVQDTVLPRGGGPNRDAPILVLKGDIVSANVFALHRSLALWGTDASVFRPERWEGRRRGWEFLPFNGGGHVCPAQSYAITEVEYVVFRLLRVFKEVRSMDNRPWTEQMGLSICNLNGVNIQLFK